MFDGYFPVCLAERNGLHATWLETMPSGYRAIAKAIEAGTAETGNTGSARRAKARSATPICPNNIAKESEGAE